MKKLTILILTIMAFVIPRSTVRAAEWYLHADTPSSDDWSTLADWFSDPVGGTNPASMSSSDTYYVNGHALRTPLNSTDVVFPGGTLVINGRMGSPGGETASGSISVKCRNSTAATTIPNLICKGGPARTFSNATGGIQVLNVNNLSVSDDEVTTFSPSTGRGLNISLGTITGNGSINLVGSGTTNFLKVTSASNLHGTIYITGSNNLTVQSGFTSGGALVIEQGSRVVLNGNITVTSLIVSGTTDPNSGLLGIVDSGTKYPGNGTYSFATLNAAFPLIFPSGTGSITVQQPVITADASSIVRTVGAGQLQVNSDNAFETLAPDYGAYMQKANMTMARIGGYPIFHSGVTGSLADLDTNVIRHLNAGAQPLFIQVIQSATNTQFNNALLNLNGVSGPGSGATPATNIAYLVKHYMQPPFNLTTQYWEVGNEPDISVTYKVSSVQEYVDYYQSIHDQLVASGVRGNVKLCGPVVSFEFGQAGSYGWADSIMHGFLTACAGPRNGYNQVDVVTRHVYPAIYTWETGAPKTLDTAYNLLNAPCEMVTFTPAQVPQKPGQGEGGILATMNGLGMPSTVGTGITEMNVGTQYRNTITQGLWFSIYDHYALYNPRNVLGMGFTYVRADSELGYFKADKTPNYPYWATYMHGVLTGTQVVAQTSSDPHLLVTASKDDSYVYLEVINRGMNDITATATLSNAPVITPPTMFELTSTTTPDVGVPTSFGTSFSYTFPAMTARIFRYLRTDAPVAVNLPPPANVVLSTSFATAPAGMQAYTSSTTFTPYVSGTDLIITNTTPNVASAVVFNGQPLSSAQNRAQVRFGFRIDSGHATTGFVFGAYSSSPLCVGGTGRALGYYGQPNRLWGVKISNYISGEVDQVGIVGGIVDQTVTSWAVHALPTYTGIEVYVVIDYDGVAGSVRARVYQGTDDTGTLWADITNWLSNPAVLPAGTVFGFAGSTQNYTEITKIHDLAITTDNTSGGTNLPSPWTGRDIGVVTPSGTASYSGGTFTVQSGYGLEFNAGYTNDRFTYVYQSVDGDCSIITRVASLVATDTALGEGAAMIRETTGTDSVFAAMGVTTGRGVKFTYRPVLSGTNISFTGSNVVAPYWMKLTRVGNTFSGYVSPTGSTWTQVGTPQTIPMGSAATMGLGVCDHGSTRTPVATFDNMTASP